MARSDKLYWTPKQREILALAQQGKSSAEIVQAGYSETSVKRVLAALKKGKVPPDISLSKADKPTTGPEPSNPPPSSKVKVRTLEPIEVGGILIEPADWRINQHGGFLITNTYEYAKQTYNYGGTVGDFLCECVQVMRERMLLDIMSFDYLLKEGGNGTGEQDGEGVGILGEIGDEHTSTETE